MAAMRQSGESTSPDSLVEAEAIANGPSTPARAPTVDHARLVEPQRGLEPSLRHQFGDPARRQDRSVAREGGAHAFECVVVEDGAEHRIGRASSWGRGGQYVLMLVVDVSVTTKKEQETGIGSS